MHNDVDRFSRWAPTYDRHHLQKLIFEPVQKTLLELAAAEVPAPRAILDVGCGTGRLLRSAEERFPGSRLEGVDAAEGMVEQARSARAPGSRVNVRVGTAEHLPFADTEFDLVFSTMTFHHWSNQRQGIAEIARVLNPTGRWLLADFIATGLMRYIRRLLRMNRFPERAELAAMLDEAGLRVIAERKVPGLRNQVPVIAIGRPG